MGDAQQTGKQKERIIFQKKKEDFYFYRNYYLHHYLHISYIVGS